MKLSDVMSSMQLAVYAEVGLVLFLFAFVLVALDLARSDRSELERAGKLPLDDAAQPEEQR